MRGQRSLTGTALIVAIIVAATGSPSTVAASPARIVDGRVSDWVGRPTRLGGTWQYSRGEFVYQDHIYDDLGPDTRQRSQQHGVTGPAAGDYRYPTNQKRYGNNAADFLELRFAADSRSLRILARMNTLLVRDGTVVAIGFDTDRDPSSGGGPWPYEAGINVPGVDRVITLWGTGGTITRLPTGDHSSLRDVAVDIDNDHNAIEARVPRPLIGRGRLLRVWAVAGLWDVADGRWVAAQLGGPSKMTPGGGNPAVSARVFNVAFRDGETGSYFDERQAAALATGDISRFRADVDLNVLESGGSRPYRVQPKRFYAAIVEQGITIPPLHEGVSYTGVPGRFSGAGGAVLTQKFSFFGRHQPYGLYVPSTHGRSAPIPAALALHGHGGSHSTYNSQPGFLRDMGEGEGTKLPPMFLITPLARGSSFYADWGEADTLAVLDDVAARFPIDRNRLYLTGYSMGGYGVYRLASLYPDRFAAAAVWAGYTGEFIGVYATNVEALTGDPTGISEMVRPTLQQFGIGGGRAGKAAIGNPVDTMENLRHLPLVHLAGTNDQVVPVSGQYAAPRRLTGLGYRSRFDLYPGYEHLTFALVDDWKHVRAWLGNQRRPRTVRDITYKLSDGWTAKGLAEELGLEHGDAWWLRNVRMRQTTEDALELASATAVSRAISGRRETPIHTISPAVAPTPHLRQSVSWSRSNALPTSNRLDLTTRGVGSLAVDTARARLEACGLRMELRTDGPLTVHLLRRGARAITVRVPKPMTGPVVVSCGR